jgi:hypothetical protein
VELYLHYPSMSSLYARRQIRLQLPEDGASVFLRNAGAHLPDFTVPQRTILNLDIKSSNYILVEIVNVKMGSACLFEILRGICIRKATKLKVDTAFPPHSFQYGVTQ